MVSPINTRRDPRPTNDNFKVDISSQIGLWSKETNCNMTEGVVANSVLGEMIFTTEIQRHRENFDRLTWLSSIPVFFSASLCLCGESSV
jgi:hypothetical protein